MKHRQRTPKLYRPERPIYYEPRQRLANPLPDVISVSVLAVILVVAHYIHS
jgi:hypothetical protein